MNQRIPAAKGGNGEFSLGNSSIYTLFEGSASEHFSWTVINHWFSFTDWPSGDIEAFEMFKLLGYSDTINWIDFMKADLTFGDWTFTLGKDCMITGGHEYDDYDWQAYTPFASPVWNDLACYQWGGMVTWTSPSESTFLRLQMCTSPFGERPFQSGLFAYSAQWEGQYGWYSPMFSCSFLGREGGKYDNLISLGNQFSFGDWTLEVDWSNTSGYGPDFYSLSGGNLFHCRFDWEPSEKWDLSLRGNYVIRPKNSILSDWWSGGLIWEYYPIRDDSELRIHAMAGYDSLLSGVTVSAGVLLNLYFSLWK